MQHSDFVTQFYNLEGDLVSERKKNFFKLLKAQPVPPNEDDLKSLSPRTHLERLFQIDIFVYFKMCSKLLDVIKEGNEIFISKILKHPSLLLEIIGNISPETFVNDFLPFTSYVTRMKILKRISLGLTAPQMNEIVSAVHRRYGLNIATKLLHTCSANKIEEYLSSYEISLTPRQLKIIFDIDSKLLQLYLVSYKNSSRWANIYDNKNLCRYIARKNPDLLFQLQKDQLIRCRKLGRRVSKTLIDHIGNDLVTNIEFYSEFLKPDAVVRKLQGNFKEAYFQLFPRDIQDIRIHNACNTLLKWYPKQKQWDLFVDTFLRVFGINIMDNLNYLSREFMPLLPDKTVLNKLAEVLYEKSKSNWDLKLCHPNKAISLIKEKINLTSSTYERNTLVKLLLENCHSYDDYVSLESVLQYICCRHLHENTYDVLTQIRECFKLEKFNEQHWKCISEMIAVVKENERLTFICLKSFGTKHLEFLILHRKPFRNELITFITDFGSNISNFRRYFEGLKIEKQVLLEAINIYPSEMEFLRVVINFNERNSEQPIDILNFPQFTTHIQSVLDRSSGTLEKEESNLLFDIINYNYKFPEKPIIGIEEANILEIFRHNTEDFGCDEAVKKIVEKPNRSEFEEEVLNFFWSDLLNRYDLRRHIVRWMFLNEPKSIIPHIDRLWSADYDCIKIKDIKLMSHLSFDKIVVDHFTGKLECIDRLLEKINEDDDVAGGNEVEIYERPNVRTIDIAINYLSELLTASEYIEIIGKRFVPIKAKIDVADNRKLQDLYYLQCEVAGALKKVPEAAIILPTVMKFCLGDYLQSALPSLYSVCYRAPEMMLYSHMDLLSNRAVSARKHSIYLSCELLTYNYTFNRLENFKEKNVSSQKNMFSAMLKYFRKNSREELMNIIVLRLTKVNRHDEETFYSLMNFKSPKIHRVAFIQKCWYTFENLRTEDVDVQYYLDSLLEDIANINSEEILTSLPIEFCKHIITCYFKDRVESDYNLNYIHRFVCLILRNLKQEQTNNFKFVFDIIASFKSNNSTKTAKSFFNTFYDIAFQDVKINSKIDTDNNYHIELFKQNWFNIFTPPAMFDQYVQLNLLYLRCKSAGDFLENYAKEVVVFLETLVQKYGPFIYSKFKDLLLQKHSFTEKEKYLFFYNILKFKNSDLNCLLIIDFLKGQCCNDEIKDIRCQMIEILKNSNQPLVSILYFDNFQ